MIDRVVGAIRTTPKLQDYRDLLFALVLFAGLAAPISIAAGLAHWSPLEVGPLFVLALRSLVVPALAEELVFRAALVPSAGDSAMPAVWIAISTGLFVIWHPVETTFLPGATSTFFRPDFLVLAAALGFSCAILRFRSRSIWTAVAFHWIVVLSWQGMFGGPSFGHLAQ